MKNYAAILTRFYARLRINQKLFLVQLITITVVCTVSLAAIQVTINIFEGILHNESAKVLNLSTVSIENELKKVEEFSFNVISNPGIQKSLVRLKSKLSPGDKFQEENNLTEILWAQTYERNITSVNIIDAYGTQYSGGYQIPENIAKYIIPSAHANAGRIAFVEPFRGDPSLYCTRLIRKARYPYLSLEPLGVLIVQVNLGRFIRQSTAGLVDKDVNLLILSGKKSIFFSNPALEKIGQSLSFKKDTGYGVYTINRHSYFIAYTRSSLTGWVYVNVVPFESVFKQIRVMRNIVLAVFILLFLLTISLSVKLARHLTKPIEKLTAKMKRVETGVFEIEAENEPVVPTSDEIALLQRDFDIMIRKINTLIKEDYLHQIVLKDTQLKALQAQVNPHFLYNTLESINWLAKTHRQPQISVMVEALGNLLRNAISNRRQIITVREEIALLESYIAIQKTRFEERLDFRLEIPEDLASFCLPKLSLQPLVENSINYGLENMTGVCRITVKAREYNECIEIIVEDNGPGLDPDWMDKLRKGTVRAQGTGLGLLSIDNRIKLHFGDEYGLSITGEKGKGTTVTVCIPKVTAESENA